MSRSEPKTKVRRQLNFQEEDDPDEKDGQQKDLYNRRVKMLIQKMKKKNSITWVMEVV